MSEDIQNIKRSLDLVDFIGSHITVKKQGSNFVACCPFHQEKTGSFIIFPEKQTFHCFGCHKGGDIFTFLMEYENVSFPEALQQLAQMAGITLNQSFRSNQPSKEKSKKWQSALDCGLNYFLENFQSQAGNAARAYMTQRGFTEKTIEKFKIGYAPDKWDGLIQYAQARNISEKDLLDVGLIKQNEQKKQYDFFRNRVIFPVSQPNGQVIAFGGRVLDKSEPKYLNSPDTPLFNKSRLLFNFHHAKQSYREFNHFLLMEGYTDVMMADQFELGPAVATLGTALTEQHVQFLKRYSVPIYLVYDGDQAGQKAMERSLPMFLKHGLDVKSVELPNGVDPCDFLLTTQDWQPIWKNILKESNDVFTFKLKRHLKSTSEGDLESKVKIAHNMLDDLKECKDPIRKDLYLEKLANDLQISRSVLEQKLPTPKHTPPVKPTPKTVRPKAEFIKDEAFMLLAIILADQDYSAELNELTGLFFSNSPTSILLQKWLQHHEGATPMALPQFQKLLSPEENEIFQAALAQTLPPKKDLRITFQEKIRSLQKPINQKDDLRKQLAKAIQEGNRELQNELMLKMKNIQK